MKFLWYVFYHSATLNKKQKPHSSYYSSAIFELTMGLGLILISIVARFLLEINAWDWILENWPYDYGRIHSKNFFAPTGVIVIICYLVTRCCLRRYFLKEEMIEKVITQFQGKESPKQMNLGSHSAGILLFSCLITAVIIMSGFIGGIILCIGFFLIWEIWVRKRFFS